MNIALFDIESTALTTRSWGIWEANAIKVVEDWHILCFSYKFLGESKVYVESCRNQSEKEVVKKLHKLFSECDILIGHNSARFDERKSNAKFIEFGLTPPEPFQTVDTLKIARRHFAFTSNKLNDLCKLFGFGEKVKHPGFEMWEGCERGEEKWWRLMERYNKGDVILLEKLYLKLLPWAKTPNVNVLDNKENSCPNCGGDKLQKRGFGFTRTGKYQRFQCQSCYAWSQSKTNSTDVNIK